MKTSLTFFAFFQAKMECFNLKFAYTITFLIIIYIDKQIIKNNIDLLTA